MPNTIWKFLNSVSWKLFFGLKNQRSLKNIKAYKIREAEKSEKLKKYEKLKKAEKLKKSDTEKIREAKKIRESKKTEKLIFKKLYAIWNNIFEKKWEKKSWIFFLKNVILK